MLLRVMVTSSLSAHGRSKYGIHGGKVVYNPRNLNVLVHMLVQMACGIEEYLVWIEEAQCDCYSLEVALKLTSTFEDCRLREICNSKWRGVGQFFRIWDLLRVKKPQRRWLYIAIPGMGKVKASIQYERLSTFCFYCGRIGHIFTSYDILKNNPLGTCLSCVNFPYPESLGVVDKS
ncbi:hypothetical protein M9H77_07713 [Catharanthus roseus]|uniref:Uncharacterized protein n=1 Tax=Catharanthus roseus TaxID=4058 RepID=A0ACC0BVQ3_CATRO|nr:hypothetical protein M9H77_07713 [Catharanthus roseus]